MKPAVSVIMISYNRGHLIAEAIDSVLNQSFTNWELIVLDDGSEDDTEQVVKNFADRRIYYFKNVSNKGISFSRNKALELAQSEFIAVLDSDDRMLPQRLSRQYDILKNDDRVGVVASYYSVIDSTGECLFTVRKELSDEEVNCYLLFGCAVSQGTSMIRKSCFNDQSYDLGLPIAEDYNLWLYIARRWRIRNLPEVLTEVRVHQQNTTRELNPATDEFTLKVLVNFYSKWGLAFEEEDLKLLLNAFYSFRKDYTLAELKQIGKLLEKIYSANKHQQFVKPQVLLFYFQKTFEKYFIEYFRINRKSLADLKNFQHPDFAMLRPKEFLYQLKFTGRTILNSLITA